MVLLSQYPVYTLWHFYSDVLYAADCFKTLFVGCCLTFLSLTFHRKKSSQGCTQHQHCTDNKNHSPKSQEASGCRRAACAGSASPLQLRNQTEQRAEQRDGRLHQVNVDTSIIPDTDRALNNRTATLKTPPSVILRSLHRPFHDVPCKSFSLMLSVFEDSGFLT